MGQIQGWRDIFAWPERTHYFLALVLFWDVNDIYLFTKSFLLIDNNFFALTFIFFT